MTDQSVLLDGPWRHTFVPANGARFHVAEAGPTGRGSTKAPLVVLLHGFPQMWWAWRHHLPILADAGYRVVAMDLRGTGASDKPPHGYDIPTLTRDVAGVIRSLGADTAVVVGHGVGGTVAWSMAALQPTVTRSVGAFAALHPLRMHSGAVTRSMLLRPSGRCLGFFQLPWLPERAMTTGDLVLRVLTEWGAPGWLTADVACAYRDAARVPFAAHSAMEILRWLVRSTPRVDGQRYLSALRTPVHVPVLQVHGTADRCVPVGAASWGNGAPYRFETIPAVGHFLPEEAPEVTAALLVDWLGLLPPRPARARS